MHGKLLSITHACIDVPSNTVTAQNCTAPCTIARDRFFPSMYQQHAAYTTGMHWSAVLLLLQKLLAVMDRTLANSIQQKDNM